MAIQTPRKDRNKDHELVVIEGIRRKFGGII